MVRASPANIDLFVRLVDKLIIFIGNKDAGNEFHNVTHYYRQQVGTYLTTIV